MPYKIKIKNIKKITHDVKEFTTDKPANYAFRPGQATEVAINKPDWKGEKRPFTFTSLPSNDDLEFTIKSYRDHNGVTDEIDTLEIGDELIIDDAWGAIQYKGPGVFIAGGAGVTPFISIFKDLEKKNELLENKLLFSNKTEHDVIHESYFREILGENFVSTLTEKESEGHENQHIDKQFLKNHIDDFSQQFYVCGPMEMVREISKQLETLGAKTDSITFEK